MEEVKKEQDGLPEVPEDVSVADGEPEVPEAAAPAGPDGAAAAEDGSETDPAAGEQWKDAEDLPAGPEDGPDEADSGLFAEPETLPEEEPAPEKGPKADAPEDASLDDGAGAEGFSEDDAEYAPPVRRRKRRLRPEEASSDGQIRKRRRPRPSEEAGEEAPVRRRKRAEDGSTPEGGPVRKKRRPAEGAGEEAPVRRRKHAEDGSAPEGEPVRRKKRPAESAGEEAPVRRRKRAEGGNTPEGEPVRKKRRPAEDTGGKRRSPEDAEKKPREESADPRIARMMREREERNARRAARRRRELIRQGAILLAAALGILFLILLLFNQKRTMVKLIGKKRVTIEAGENWEDPGAKAVYGGRTLPFGRTEIPYETATDLDLGKVGTYSITYHAEYEGREGQAVRTVTVKDTTPPVITLTEDPDWYTLPGSEYEEEGFTAEDNCDGDLTESVVREEKDGKVYYSVTDSSGNVGTAEREIVYDDKGAPDLMLYNALPVVEVGQEWTDAYYAEDDLDGDVTDKVVVTGEVDTDEPGTYTIEYSVTDEHGNEATAEREVRVVEELTEDELPDQTIFLTFDDGPYEYTDELLDTLDKYNVKVTFFVTAQFEDYLDCIEREADEGHTVAVHTYKHRFEDVYESTDAYWEDFEKMNDIIEEQTGERTELFRFPGGSSNTISRRYSEGIMSELTSQAKDRGLDYYDWNVSSGDAGEYTDSFEIWDSITDQIWDHKCSVILCHDIHEYTVDCIEDVITYALENGFSFMPLQKGIYTCHHPVNN